MVFLLVNISSRLSAQLVIAQPRLEFTNACANDDFNQFETIFSFNPASALNSDNTFVVEISDKDGDFTDAVVAFQTAPGAITSSPASIFFPLPEDTAGENYKIRIKSTSPVGRSAPSKKSFAAYFKKHDTPFTINGLVETGNYCPGTGYLLTIDNPGLDGDTSPLSFGTLNFDWFRVIDSSNSVLVAQGESFLATSEGTYFVETNYGSCSSQSFSNRVIISLASSDEPANANITSSLGTTFCAGTVGTTLSTITGGTYQWFKDDVEIPGQNENSFQTNESGNYAVIVRNGDCVAVGSLEIESTSQSSTLTIPEINVIEAGDVLTASVDTSLSEPTFEWYLNDVLIEGQTEGSLQATQVGFYRVVVTGTGACSVATELSFEVRIGSTSDIIPNTISVNGDGLNDTWALPAIYLSGTNTKIEIYSSNGILALETTEYLNNWPLASDDVSTANQVFYYKITPVDGEILVGSITLVR